MRSKGLYRFASNDRGAVAATYALSLFALVGIAGVAFDYARLAGMDSELQNGADQAALAGVTQLDKEDGACARATNAAIALLNNETLLANDIGERSVLINSGNTIPIASDSCTGTTGIVFYEDKEKTTVASTDETAAFLEVTVDARTAEYAFTPIVGAFAGTLEASAFAGLGSAICKVPPLMICRPDPNTPFNAAGRIGWGVKATGHGGAGGTWAPGTFGFLEVGTGQTADLVEAIAFGEANLDCAPADGTLPETGNAQDLYRAVNTRFDIYDFASGGGTTLGPCYSGLCPPAPNVTKDVINTNTNTTGQNACKIGNNGWRLPTNRFRPKARDVATDTASTIFDLDGVGTMGLPRDLCHYNSYNTACNTLNGLATDVNSKFGNGNWARGDYFQTHHGGMAAVKTAVSGHATNPDTWTRYQTYLWEQGKLTAVNSVTGAVETVPGYAMPPQVNGQKSAPFCQPVSTGAIDRRILTVAVVSNCPSLSGGSTEVEVDEWVDMFLVEPVVDDNVERANGRGADVIYMEVVRPATVGNNSGGGGPQNVRRDVPYLIE